MNFPESDTRQRCRSNFAGEVITHGKGELVLEDHFSQLPTLLEAKSVTGTPSIFAGNKGGIVSSVSEDWLQVAVNSV